MSMRGGSQESSPATNSEEEEDAVLVEDDNAAASATSSLQDLNSISSTDTSVADDDESDAETATTASTATSTSTSTEEETLSIDVEDVSSSDETAEEEEEQSSSSETTLASDTPTINSVAMEVATTLRLQGKDFHDQGDFDKAAELFQAAADSLLEDDEAAAARMTEEYATCRLHQALCHLKSDQYDLCIEACTDVLQDEEDDSATSSSAPFPTFADQSPPVKARAYHRRAKARMGLGDTSGALQDARTAAFLGDSKAVALYGKIMRESSSSSLGDAMNPLLSSQSSSSPSSALLESLMQKSPSTGTDNSGLPDFSPASLLMGNGSGGNGMLDALGSGAGGGLAKSVLKSLSKRMDDDATHEQISGFLQRANKTQLRSLASMAGMNDALQDSTIDSLVKLCNGVKPKHIKRTVRTTKVVVYMVKLIRKIFKVINKYKTILAGLLILQWMKSATLRPIPINKKAARKAAKKALKEGMKATRGMF
ncbi:MAG: hypothetical protein SGILL_000031 [Bacillariaceae sp.]